MRDSVEIVKLPFPEALPGVSGLDPKFWRVPDLAEEDDRYLVCHSQHCMAGIGFFVPPDGFAGFLPYLVPMSLLPYFVGRRTMNLARSVLFAGLCGVVTMHGADSTQEAPPPELDPDLPQSVKEESFEAIIKSSPFTRSLGVSDSLILTGIAHIEKDVFATLLDTATMESHVVSKSANPQGWQLVGVGGDETNLQTLSARIQVPGGQVISVRYQKPPPKSLRARSRGGSGGSSGNSVPLSAAQMDEARKAAVNYREGFNADGYPKAPPSDMVDKLSRLSVSQREDINREMFGYRNQGLGMEERRKIYEGLVDRSGQGRR